MRKTHRGEPQGLALVRAREALRLALPDKTQRQTRFAGLTRDPGTVEYWYDATGIYGILIGGTDIPTNNILIDYQIIGTITGADDANNVTSGGSDGRTLKSAIPGGGAPFTLACHRINGTTLQVDITVGPIPRDYKSLSVPLDPIKAKVAEASFRYAHAGYVVGCGSSWSSRPGTGSRYDAIPTPCVIPNVGRVGLARAGRLDPWFELVMPTYRLRRLVLASNAVEMACVNHPGTNNLEIGWAHDPAIGPLLRAGSIWTLSEQIAVIFADDPAPIPPGPSTPAPTFTQAPTVSGLTPDGLGGVLRWATSLPTKSIIQGHKVGDPFATVALPDAATAHEWGLPPIVPGAHYELQVTATDPVTGHSVTSTLLPVTTPTAPAPIPPTPTPSPPGGSMRITIPPFDVPAAGGQIPVVITATPAVGPVPIPPLPPATWRPDILLGYGPVNAWPVLSAERVAKALNKAGCTVTQIEGIAWWDGVDHGADRPLEEHWDLVKDWILVMRSHAITTLLVVVNMNGTAIHQQSDQWFRDKITWLRDNVGTDRVILEPVSEPSDSRAHTWMGIAMQEWPGALAQNGDNGRGRPAVGGRGYDGTWHCCDDPMTDMARARVVVGDSVIVNTDCGPTLGLNPEWAGRCATRAIQSNTHFCVYSFATDIAEIEATIAGMGAAIQAQAPSSPPPPGESPYVRWPDTGVATAAQITGIYQELLGRAPDPGGLAHYLSLHWTPAQVWYDIRISPEYRSKHPGAPTPVKPPSMGGPPIGGVTPPPATGSNWPGPGPEPTLADITVGDWNDDEVLSWPQTSTVTAASMSGGTPTIDHTQKDHWPAVASVEHGSSFNVWVVVQTPEVGWLAHTFEWAEPGRTSWGGVHGSDPTTGSPSLGNHTGDSRLINWVPAPGEVFGFLASGLYRSTARNVEERSQIYWVTATNAETAR